MTTSPKKPTTKFTATLQSWDFLIGVIYEDTCSATEAVTRVTSAPTVFSAVITVARTGEQHQFAITPGVNSAVLLVL